jgi:hypothetical protein
MAQRHNGTTAQRHNGTTAQWHNGTTAQRHNGTTAQRHNGTMAQWRDESRCLLIKLDGAEEFYYFWNDNRQVELSACI